MKLAESKIPKRLIIYLYGVFLLNIIDIFYLNRTNSAYSFGFILTLLIPIFFAVYLTRRQFMLTSKAVFLHVFILVIIFPLIFFIHIALAL
jgi:hypothetical protein